MQELKAAVAVFCTVCICAELVMQITGDGWPRRGIKAVAALYILTVALRVIPQVRTEEAALSIPAASPAELGSLEDALLAQTSAELERQAEANCRGKTGAEVELCVALEKTTAGVTIRAVTGTLPENCTPEQKRALDAAVEETLHVQPEWTMPGGETLP